MSKKAKTVNRTTIKKFKSAQGTVAINRRGAEFFAWAAKHFPKQIVPWPLAYTAVTGLRASVNSKQVALFRNKGGAIRTVLKREYACSLTVEPSVGARATVNQDDVVATELKIVGRRAQGVFNNLESVRALVSDPKKLKNAADRSYYNDVSSVMKRLGAYNKQLAAPKADEDAK